MYKLHRFESLNMGCLNGLSSLICTAARDMIFSRELWEKAIVKGPGNNAPFSRKARKLPKEKVLISVLDIRRSTLSVKLNEQHECVGACGDPPSAQAFSKARMRMNEAPFRMLFSRMVRLEYEYRDRQSSLSLVDGMLVLAIDGSILQLPNLPAFREDFFDANGSPSALMSVLYDTMNNRVLEADLSDTRDEGAAATRLVEQAEDIVPHIPKVILFDRGYASFELVKYLEDKGLKYCFRMKRGFRAIDSIGLGGIEDIAFGDVDARAMRLVLPSGEVEMLLTNIDDGKWEMQDFADLYHMRWGIEEEYRNLKRRLHLEAFTGKTENTVKQDFWASLLADNMLGIVESEMNEEIQEARKGKKNRYEYEANRNALVGHFRSYYYKILSEPDPDMREAMMQHMMERARRLVIPIKPGRGNPRTKRICNHHHNCKTNV